MGKMRTSSKLYFVLSMSLALIMAGCSTAVDSSQQPPGMDQAGTGVEDDAEVEQPEEAEPVPTPTPEPTKAPTPTIPPGWFEGMGIDESDYMYYNDLLITADDPLTSASVTQDYGVSMVLCDTCDLVAGKFLSILFTGQVEEFMISNFLFRFLSAEALNDAMTEISTQFTENGFPPAELPSGTDLPAESMLFQSPLVSGLVIPFELFEIRILQEQPNSLSPEENSALLIEMAEIQLAKLKAAGY